MADIGLVAASLAANVHVFLCFAVSQVIYMLIRRKRSKINLAKAPHCDNNLEKFVMKHRNHVSAIFVDTFLTLGLFVGGLYLLTGGKAVSGQPFGEDTYLNINPNVPTVLFSIAIGRLCIAFVLGIQRMRAISSPLSASISIMQCVDHLVALVFLILIVIYKQDLLTGSLILIMCVDTNVYTINIVLSQQRPHDLAPMVTVYLKIFQCFLSIAFRGVVPLICVVVSLVMSNDIHSDSTAESLAVFISAAIFYAAYNPCMIYYGVSGLWRAYGEDFPKETKTKDPAFFVNNNKGNTHCNRNKIPLAFNITKDNFAKTMDNCGVYVQSFTDLSAYQDPNIPPPYSACVPQGRQSGPYFQPSLHVPASVVDLPEGRYYSGTVVSAQRQNGTALQQKFPNAKFDAEHFRQNNQQLPLYKPPRRQKRRCKQTVTVLAPLQAIPEDSESVASN